MYIDRIRINWDKIPENSYLTRIGSICLLQELRFRRPVTFFVGENGVGKSTLLEAIAIAYGFNPEGGSLNYSFSTHDDYSELCDAITIGRGVRDQNRGFFLRAESFYNVSTKAMEYERGYGPMYGNRTLHEQSHGESFLNFIKSFTKTGIFIMDEPEAALSAQRQLSLFSRIAEMSREGSQYIIVTHSPILLAIPDADIIGFDQYGIRYLSYEDTESYRITEMFINHRETMVKELLGE
ncbi:MAG: AAA family ATPase [Bacteroidales bacterium]|nr:AAA family ATPase [Bacteroidales bacterium]